MARNELIVLAGDPLPGTTFDGLFHVGTLNPDDKGERYGYSYEGRGLSVSTHPEDWVRIAKLGGKPIWRATRPGNIFIDRWCLTKGQELAIASWAVSEGLCAYEQRWAVDVPDETGEIVVFHVKSRDEAVAEAASYYGIGELDGAISEQRVLVVSEDGSKRTGFPVGDSAGAFDAALISYAAACTEFDGVWWDDDHRPEALSAPRGTILEHHIADWTFEWVA